MLRAPAYDALEGVRVRVHHAGQHRAPPQAHDATDADSYPGFCLDEGVFARAEAVRDFEAGRGDDGARLVADEHPPALEAPAHVEQFGDEDCHAGVEH